jgi:hypothetical protein
MNSISQLKLIHVPHLSLFGSFYYGRAIGFILSPLGLLLCGFKSKRMIVGAPSVQVLEKYILYNIY